MHRGQAREPKLCFHKASRRAYVTLDGREVYLGGWDGRKGTPRHEELLTARLRVLLEWREGGGAKTQQVDAPPITIGELVERFMNHARRTYSTGAIGALKTATDRLVDLYQDCAVLDFGPVQLRAYRSAGLDRGWARSTANAQTARVKAMLRWAEDHDLIGELSRANGKALRVKALPRSKAYRESEPVTPPSKKDLDKVLALLPPPVAAMAQLQALTGARPGEIVRLKAGDIDRSGSIGIVVLKEHKTMRFTRR